MMSQSDCSISSSSDLVLLPLLRMLALPTFTENDGSGCGPLTVSATHLMRSTCCCNWLPELDCTTVAARVNFCYCYSAV